MLSHLQTKKNHKKFSWLAIFLILFMSLQGLLTPQKTAHAQYPDIWFVINKAVEEAEAVAKDSVKALVLGVINVTITDWISGTASHPQFISDFDGWLLGAADDAVSTVLNDRYGEDFSRLCNGINPQIILYLMPSGKPKPPPCTLSEIQAKFQNIGQEWQDFAFTIEGANSDTGYLFSVLDNAQQTRQDIKTQQAVKAIAGQGYGDASCPLCPTQLPGKTVGDLLSNSIMSTFNITTESTSLENAIGPALVTAVVTGLMIRGLNAYKAATNK
jgi:hypothetical protein